MIVPETLETHPRPVKSPNHPLRRTPRTFQMNTDDNLLGGRLPLLPPTDLSPAQRKLHGVLVEKMVSWANDSGFQADTGSGALIGPFNPMLYSPQIGKALIDYLGAEREHTALNARVREVVILTVGAVWKTAYELYAHTIVARKEGLDASSICALAAGEAATETLSVEESAAHEFTRVLVAERRVDAELYARTVEIFGEKGVVDMIHLAGNYMTVSVLLNAFEVPAPPAPEPAAER